MRIDRRKLRKQLGSRTSRRNGTKTPIVKNRKPSCRSRLSALIAKLPPAGV